MAEFLRDYQLYAVDTVLHTFDELDPRRTARGEDVPIRKRVSIVVAQTASGKTLIIKTIADRLAQQGYQSLVLAPLSPVVAQNKAAGLNSATIHSLFGAFKDAEEQKLRGTAAQRYVSSRLGLPPDFLSGEMCVMIDESHWAAENFSEIYMILNLLPRIRMIVGFTATPRNLKGVFEIIDLREMARSSVAAPRGSVVVTQSLLSLPNQLLWWPSPGLIFTRSVAAGAVIQMAMNIIRPGTATLMVGDPRSSLEGFARRAMNRQAAKAEDDLDLDTAGVAPAGDAGTPATPNPGAISGGAPGATHGTQQGFGAVGWEHMNLPGRLSTEESSVFSVSFRPGVQDENPQSITIDRRERGLGVCALILCLDALSALGKREAEAGLARLSLAHGGVPRFPDSLMAVEEFAPAAWSDFRAAVVDEDKRAIEAVVTRIRGARIHSTQLDANFRLRPRAGVPWFGISVAKASTGLNLPELRTVVIAEGIVESVPLFIQRCGRGARRMINKTFFDICEVSYMDPLSDGGTGLGGVSWLTTYIREPARRTAVARQLSIFREVCDPEV